MEKGKTLFGLPIHGRKTNRLVAQVRPINFLKTKCLLLKKEEVDLIVSILLNLESM
jgi:hypothetical protein